MKMFTQPHTKQIREEFLKQNKDKDHVILLGDDYPVILSAPHGVNQWREGRDKYCEPGTINTVLHLHKMCNCPAILKTKNNHDDANWDEVSSYKTALFKFIKDHKIKYVLDIHSLAASRPCDVNLGVWGGKLVANNNELYRKLVQSLCDAGFNVYLDEPFNGGGRTISASVKKEFGDSVWAIQIELNSKIIWHKRGFEKYKKLLDVLATFIVEL